MNDDLEAPQEGAEEVVQSEEIEQVSEASEGTESTEGTTEKAPAEESQETEDEKERKSRSERRREARERAQQELRESEAKRQEAERRVQAIREASKNLPAPKQDDFATYEDFQAALSAHHAVKMLDSREAQKLEAEAKAQFEQVKILRQRQAQEDAENWQSQMAEAASRYADFTKVALQDAYVTDQMATFISRSDVGADIAYHLGKNRDLGVRISQMSPMEMAMAFGRLEATVSAPQSQRTTNAPPPINPVRGKGTASKDPGDMNPSEYKAWIDAGGKF